MEGLDYIEKYLESSLEVKQKIKNDAALCEAIGTTAAKIEVAYKSGRKVLIAGNGGSAGDAQHIAAEFVSRFFYDRPGLPAIALTTDTSMLTAIGNDYGFEKIFSRQVQAQGAPGDIFIGISTSGNSKNVINAVAEAKKNGLVTVCLCGQTGQLQNLVDISLAVPSASTPHIQEGHIVIGHIICALVERSIFPQENSCV